MDARTLSLCAGSFVVGAACVSLIQKKQKKARNNSLPNTPAAPALIEDPNPEETEELFQEQLSRIVQYFGPESFPRIRNAFVIVVGAGGVGSHAANMLARSGVQNIRIIDFDIVSLSSLNRHAVAFRPDVGTPKVEALKRYLSMLGPHVHVDPRNVMFNAENADELLAGNPQFVIDAIDNIDTKVDLLAYCVQHNLPVVSSMSAGGRADPSRIRIGDINETVQDPLSRVVRRNLRKKGIDGGIPVVFSNEKAPVKLLPLDEHIKDNYDEYTPMANLRLRVMPVLGTTPALFGNSLAAFVLTHLAGQPIKPTCAEVGRAAAHKKIRAHLANRETRLFNNNLKEVDIDLCDVEYMVDEVWKARSAVSASLGNVALTRWRKDGLFEVGNMVLLTAAEAKLHDAAENLSDLYTEDVIARIDARLKEARSSQ